MAVANSYPDVEFAGYAFTPGADGVHGDFQFFFQNKDSTGTGAGPFSTTSGMRLRITYDHSIER